MVPVPKDGGGRADGLTDRGIDRHVVELLPNADPGTGGGLLAQRNRHGEWVGWVVCGQHGKKQTQILGGACHRSGDGGQAGGISKRGEVAGGGNAAGSWLQSGDAAEVRRNADRSAAIA